MLPAPRIRSAKGRQGSALEAADGALDGDILQEFRILWQPARNGGGEP